MGLNPIYPGGGPYGPPTRKSAVFGRKNEIFQKWMDGKKPSKSPGLIGLFRPDMGLNPIYPGGGHMAPQPENRPFPVEKMKFFKNGWTEKALPKPHNPTYTLRFHCIYSNPF